MLYLRSFNRFILIGLALLGISLSGQASAVSITHSGMLDEIDDTPYFDDTLGILESVTVFYLFDAETEYSGLCFSDSMSGGCRWEFLGGISHGVDGPAGVLDPDSTPYGASGFVAGGETFFSGQLLHTLSYEQEFTGAQAQAFIGNGFFGYAALVDGPCVEIGETQTVFCTSTQFTSGAKIVETTYEWSAVGAVPIPAAIWLFGTALIGLVGFSRKSKST